MIWQVICYMYIRFYLQSLLRALSLLIQAPFFQTMHLEPLLALKKFLLSIVLSGAECELLIATV